MAGRIEEKVVRVKGKQRERERNIWCSMEILISQFKIFVSAFPYMSVLIRNLQLSRESLHYGLL